MHNIEQEPNACVKSHPGSTCSSFCGYSKYPFLIMCGFFEDVICFIYKVIKQTVNIFCCYLYDNIFIL